MFLISVRVVHGVSAILYCTSDGIRPKTSLGILEESSLLLLDGAAIAVFCAAKRSISFFSFITQPS